jgi:hypothetical protein
MHGDPDCAWIDTRCDALRERTLDGLHVGQEIQHLVASPYLYLLSLWSPENKPRINSTDRVVAANVRDDGTRSVHNDACRNCRRQVGNHAWMEITLKREYGTRATYAASTFCGFGCPFLRCTHLGTRSTESSRRGAYMPSAR